MVTQGGVLRYRLTVHNPNAYPVTATVTDDLGDILDKAGFLHATPGPPTVTVDTTTRLVTWHGILQAGQTVTIRYSFRIHTDAGGIVANRVVGPPAASCLPPASPELPCVTETPIVPPPGPGADLSVTKIPSTRTTHPGDQVLYTLVVRNHGPLDATGVTVEDPVPPGLFFHTAQPSQGSCTLTATNLVCRLGRIREGGSAVVLVQATVATDARGSITNVADVYGREHDPRPDNNTARSTVSVTLWTEREQTSDLVVAKHGPSTVTQGQRFQYTITVTNRGPDSASDVMLTDAAGLPFTVVSIHPTQGHCQSGAPIRCALGTLHNGAHVTITVTAVATTAGRQVNTAIAMSPSWDPGPGSNLAQARTRIVPVAVPSSPRVTG